MGLLDDAANMAVSKLAGEGGGQSSNLTEGVLDLLKSHPGGVSGLLESFHQQGLGALVSSWVGSGENLPISAEQIQAALGNERVQQFAQKAGISPDVASSKLAELLPTIVDKLTPEGKAPEGSSMLQEAAALFKAS